MKHCCNRMNTDFGPYPYVTNVARKAVQNDNYRMALWTGCYGQMTLMSIPVGSDIGLEIHRETDQFIRIEQGLALVKMGECECNMNYKVRACKGDTIFVPAGTWHNVLNIGRVPLKLTSIYTPPHHPAGTLYATKEDAEHSDY